MMTRTPYSVGPYGPTAYPRALGPSPKFTDAGFIFVYQDVRGRFMSEGDFVHMTPWKGMAGAIATDESTDAYDTIDWVRLARAAQHRTCGHMGRVVPGFLHGRRARQCAPRAQGGVAAGAADRLVHGRRRAPSRHILAHERLRVLHDERPGALAPTPTTDRPRSIQLWHRRRLRVLSGHGTAIERRQAVSQGRRAVLERHDGARHRGRILAGSQGRAASRERHAGGADRQRMVRREQSAWRVARPRGDRASRVQRRPTASSSAHGRTANGRAARATRSAT